MLHRIFINIKKSHGSESLSKSVSLWISTPSRGGLDQKSTNQNYFSTYYDKK